MRIVFKKREGSQIEFGIIYGGIVLLALVAARFLPVLDWAPSCLFKTIFGIACPTCGATRSVVLLSRFDMSSAFFMNPFVCIAAVLAVLIFLHDGITLLIHSPRIGITFEKQEKKRLLKVLFMIGMANWLYLVLTL